MNPLRESPKLVSRKELAAALGRSVAYVSAMKCLGFSAIVPGKYVFDDAIAWLQSHESFRMEDCYRHKQNAKRKRLQTKANTCKRK